MLTAEICMHEYARACTGMVRRGFFVGGRVRVCVDARGETCVCGRGMADSSKGPGWVGLDQSGGMSVSVCVWRASEREMERASTLGVLLDGDGMGV